MTASSSDSSISPLPDHAPVDDLVRSLYRLGLVQREISRHASDELGSQGFTALAVIHRAGSVRIGEVARRLGIDSSVASRQVAALMAAGHVDREPDPEDRRAWLVTVSEAGTRVLKETHRRMVDAFAGALADWPEDEVLDLAKGLHRLRDDFARTAAGTPRIPHEVLPT